MEKYKKRRYFVEAMKKTTDSIIIKTVICFALALLIVLVFAFFLRMYNDSFYSERDQNESEKDQNESKLVFSEVPLNYEAKINLNSLGNNSSDFVGDVFNKSNSEKILFREIHAICAPTDLDCYVFSSPFNYIYKSGENKVEIIQIRVENADLEKPRLAYYEYNDSNYSQKMYLDELRFSSMEYPYLGTKGNLFLNLTLDLNKTYCFQLEDGKRTSDILCQTFQVDFLSRDFIRLSLASLDNLSDIHDIHLFMVFKDRSEQEIKEGLMNCSLRLFFPEEFSIEVVEFSSEDLLNNFKFCGGNYLVDLTLSLEDDLIEKIVPKINGTEVLDAKYKTRVEVVRGSNSLILEAIFDMSCESQLHFCDNFV